MTIMQNLQLTGFFNNPGDDGIIESEGSPGENDGSGGRIKKPSVKDEIKSYVDKFDVFKSSRYVLKSVVCHKGSSVYTGHYVCFVRKEIEGKDSWVLFNDEKVVLANDDSNMKDIVNNGYLYFYAREG